MSTPSDATVGAAGRGRRGRTATVAAVAVAVALALAAVAVLGGDGGPDGSAATQAPATSAEPEPSTDPAEPTPEPVDRVDEAELDEASAIDGATRALVRHLEAVDATLAGGGLALVEATATGPALDEVRSIHREFDSSDWRQTGAVEVQVIEDRAVELDGEPTTVALEVCLDATAVGIVDADDQVVRAPDEDDPTRTSRHRYEVVLADGLWLVHRHGFPDDATC